MAVINNISVWWHVAGAAIVILDPDHRPGPAPELQLRLHRADQQLRLQRRASTGSSCCRSGFLLTQYTITGFDASAHLSEETQGRPRARPRASGVRSSTRCSAATSCCWPSCSPCRTPRESATACGGGRRDLRSGAPRRLALPDPADLHGRAALLCHGVPDQRLADDVRVQPGRRDPGFDPAFQGEQDHTDPGQRSDLRRRSSASSSRCPPSRASAASPVAFYAVVSSQ